MLNPRQFSKTFPLACIRKAISIKVHQRSTLSVVRRGGGEGGMEVFERCNVVVQGTLPRGWREKCDWGVGSWREFLMQSWK